MEMAQSPGDQVPGIESNVSVELNVERFDGCSGLYVHHRKPAAVSLRSQSIRLGSETLARLQQALDGA